MELAEYRTLIARMDGWLNVVLLTVFIHCEIIIRMTVGHDNAVKAD